MCNKVTYMHAYRQSHGVPHPRFRREAVKQRVVELYYLPATHNLPLDSKLHFLAVTLMRDLRQHFKSGGLSAPAGSPVTFMGLVSYDLCRVVVKVDKVLTDHPSPAWVGFFVPGQPTLIPLEPAEFAACQAGLGYGAGFYELLTIPYLPDTAV